MTPADHLIIGLVFGLYADMFMRDGARVRAWAMNALAACSVTVGVVRLVTT